MEMSALTFLSWVVISAEGWSFLVEAACREVEGWVGFTTGDGLVGCFVGGGRVGSRWLGLVAGAASL